MMDILKQVQDLMQQNRRIIRGYQYTVPSPQTYPYQWLWDSCFHAIILSHFSIEDAQKEILSIISRQFDNGMIPHMIYWQKKTKSDFPVIEWGKEDTSTITQPPMLAYAVWQIYLKNNNISFVKQVYPSLVKFYSYFLPHRDPHQKGLISIINPDESGEDNSPRFDTPLGLPPKHTLKVNFKQRIKLIENNYNCNFESGKCMRNFFWVKDVPINTIYAQNLQNMSDLAAVLNNSVDADNFLKQSQQLKQSMRDYMLEDDIFWSIYLDPKNKKYKKNKVKTWAMFAPLFANIYSSKEAEIIVKKYLLNSKEFNTPFIVPTVSFSDPSFNPKGFWRGPVWMAVNWFIVKGLKKYGFKDIANKIMESSINLLEKNGFREYYNPLTGKGLGAKDFTWGGLVLDM